MALPKNLHDFDLKALKIESKITSKPEKKPQFSVIYGKGGIGKSSLASYSHDPIILPVGRETGHEGMYVPKFPNSDEMGLSIINHVFACLSWVIKNEHTRKTLIIDNGGSYREGVDEDVESSNVGVDLKAFGKGASFAYPYYTRLMAAIDEVIKRRNMNVILLAHDGAYNVNLPDGTYFQKISVNMPGGENTNVRGLIEARAHNVFYMVNESPTMNVKNNFGVTKKIATSGNVSRVIYTKPAGNFFAKSRVNLDDYYPIIDSGSEEELLKDRTNPDMVRFWSDVYK